MSLFFFFFFFTPALASRVVTGYYLHYLQYLQWPTPLYQALHSLPALGRARGSA